MRFFYSTLFILLFFFQSCFSQSKTELAMLIDEKDLIPESIAYHAGSQQYFVGSLYKQKIIAIKDGVVRDFVPAGFKGMGSVCGMKMDESNNILYAVILKTKYIPVQVPQDVSWYTAVVAYDVYSGQLLHEYAAKDSALFNDLVVAGNGNIYVTDPIGGAVYELNPKTGRIHQFTPTKTFIGPNGITVYNNDLFIAHAEGITKMSISSGQKQLLSFQQSTDTIAGIDGLYFYQNTLIGIQNTVFPKRILRMQLNASMDKVDAIQVLDSSSLPIRKYSPTTGTVVGSDFYFIENAQVRAFDKKGIIFPMEDLDPVRIKKIKLRN